MFAEVVPLIHYPFRRSVPASLFRESNLILLVHTATYYDIYSHCILSKSLLLNHSTYLKSFTSICSVSQLLRLSFPIFSSSLLSLFIPSLVAPLHFSPPSLLPPPSFSPHIYSHYFIDVSLVKPFNIFKSFNCISHSMPLQWCKFASTVFYRSLPC